jgi:predicted GNAT family acetyltransferase
MARTSAVSVRDNPAEHRYELLVDGSVQGRIYYRDEPGVITLVHTEVARELEGQGLGGRLVTGALDDIRARGLRLVPVCPFVVSYLGRHPEYADLVPLDPARSR